VLRFLVLAWHRVSRRPSFPAFSFPHCLACLSYSLPFLYLVQRLVGEQCCCLFWVQSKFATVFLMHIEQRG